MWPTYNGMMEICGDQHSSLTIWCRHDDQMNALAHNLDSCTVLVIDDDEIIRMVVREGLRAFGCTVVEAGDPEVGIGMAHQTHPDVIILDIMLPRIDGLSLLERMRAEEIASSVIVFSATGTRHAERAMELGAFAYLPKPFELTELVEQVAGGMQLRKAA